VNQVAWLFFLFVSFISPFCLLFVSFLSPFCLLNVRHPARVKVVSRNCLELISDKCSNQKGSLAHLKMFNELLGQFLPEGDEYILPETM
jgi:hypothetical protein